MSVFNDAPRIPESVESVLAQKDIDFEFIIIDDGSTDDSFEILNGYALQDSRMRLVRQANTGLTRALRNGCELAVGVYIARQDAGDIYLEQKLARQAKILRDHPDVSMVTCGTRFVGPRGEYLFDVDLTTETVEQGLRSLDIKTIRGPSSHTSLMFRKSGYDRAGGYRPEFVVSQDLDLWLRLIEQGGIVAIPEIMIVGELSPASISGASHQLQMRLGEVLIECAKRRQIGETEEDLLRRAYGLKRSLAGSSKSSQSNSVYFIGRLLETNRDRRCISYLREAVALDLSNWKALLRLLHAQLTGRAWPSVHQKDARVNGESEPNQNDD
ncbi:MAG: glycosyltransferase [Gammaproteobacteria bacterium]|nr:glycosyltransferase [Gammaproteobacteria bacterium]